MTDTDYKITGRPPKKPANKVGKSVRCLVTPGVRKAVEAGMQLHGIEISDYLRLALYRQLEKDGLLDKALERDSTFELLKGIGQV